MTKINPDRDAEAGQDLLERAIGNLRLDRDLVFRFLVAFTRFEFALKAARFVFKGESEQALRADFDCFAKNIAKVFQEKLDGGDEALRSACEFYRRSPPEKQIWSGSDLDWKEALPQNRRDSEFFLILLRRTRNNLFHGGKGWKRPEDDPHRDNLLMRHGLRILEAMISSQPDVRREFSTFE